MGRKEQIINYLLNANNFNNTNVEFQHLIKVLEITPSYPIILVAGTNGKGSTCAYLTTILSNAGYKVGTFTSPHVFEYNERIQINNQPVDDNILITALDAVIKSSNDNNLGIFKTFTLASHIIFMNEKIDIAIVEVGVGGANDVTNYFEPTIAAVSNVDFDHCAILGNTLEEIGLQKAGIFRANKPALYGAINPPQTLIQYAKTINAKFTCFGQDFGFKRHEYGWDFYSPQLNLYSLPFPSMRGQEQLLNASLAIAILANLKYDFPLTSSQIKTGLLQTSLVGRFQVIPGLPQIILDTAHNIQAVEVMWQNVLKLQFAKHNYALFAIANDKNWQVIIEQQAKNYDHWFLSRLGSERSANPEDVLQKLLDCGVNSAKISISNNVTEAFLSTYNQLKQEDRLVCFGSFLTVEQAYIALHKVRK